MNTNKNSEVVNSLSTSCDSFKPARDQSFPSIVSKDRYGDWIGKTEWLFSERPAQSLDEPGEWVICLRTSKVGRLIFNTWSVVQNYNAGGMKGTRFMMFGDFSHRESASGGASRATSKAIAEAHTLAVQQIERIAAAAVAFYAAKADKEALRA